VEYKQRLIKLFFLIKSIVTVNNDCHIFAPAVQAKNGDINQMFRFMDVVIATNLRPLGHHSMRIARRSFFSGQPNASAANYG